MDPDDEALAIEGKDGKDVMPFSGSSGSVSEVSSTGSSDVWLVMDVWVGIISFVGSWDVGEGKVGADFVASEDRDDIEESAEPKGWDRLPLAPK